MKAKIHVTLKNGVLDPQGKAVGRALEALDIDCMREVSKSKYIEIDLPENNKDTAKISD